MRAWQSSGIDSRGSRAMLGPPPGLLRPGLSCLEVAYLCLVVVIVMPALAVRNAALQLVTPHLCRVGWQFAELTVLASSTIAALLGTWLLVSAGSRRSVRCAGGLMLLSGGGLIGWRALVELDGGWSGAVWSVLLPMGLWLLVHLLGWLSADARRSPYLPISGRGFRVGWFALAGLLCVLCGWGLASRGEWLGVGEAEAGVLYGLPWLVMTGWVIVRSSRAMERYMAWRRPGAVCSG